MIIAAIDDDLLLDSVLEQLTDSVVVIECLSGRAATDRKNGPKFVAKEC